MDALVLDSHEDDPHVVQPTAYSIGGLLLDALEHHGPDIVPEDLGVGQGGPVVVAFIEVVPVHLVDPHSEHLLVFLIDSIPDDSMIDEFIDVDCCGVSEVEDEGVAEGLIPMVEGLLHCHQLEQLLVKLVGLDEVVFDLFFESGVVLDEDGLGGQFGRDGLRCFQFIQLYHGNLMIIIVNNWKQDLSYKSNKPPVEKSSLRSASFLSLGKDLTYYLAVNTVLLETGKYLYSITEISSENKILISLLGPVGRISVETMP